MSSHRNAEHSSWLVGLVASVVVFAFGLVEAEAATPPDDSYPGTAIGSTGEVSLRDLGIESIRLSPSEATAELLGPLFEAGAKQGGSQWYLMHVHLTVKVNPALPLTSAEERAYVVATVNDRAVAQLKIEPHLGPRSRGLRWSAIELLSGSSTGTVLESSADLHYSNYLQDRSVVAEAGARLGFEIQVPDHLGDDWLEAVTIHDDTSILTSPLGPAELELDVVTDEMSLASDGTGTLPIILRSGGLPARDVRAQAVSSTGAPASNLVVLDEVGDRDTHVNLTIDSEVTEDDWFEVHVRGQTGGQQVAYLEFDATTGRDVWGPRVRLGTALLLGLLVMALLIGRSFRSRERASRRR